MLKVLYLVALKKTKFSAKSFPIIAYHSAKQALKVA